MRLCRFTHPDSGAKILYGRVEGAEVFPLADFSFDAEKFSLDESEAHGSGAESRRGNGGVDVAPLAHASVSLVAPVTPSKIVCVGRNYADHAAELGNAMPTEPLLFLKPPSAIVAHEATIELPRASERVEHEGELGVVIGRRCRNLDDDVDPLAFVFGYTCLNDVTARDLQRRDVQFTRGKSFDTFCPVGPHVVTDLDPTDLRVTTRVNGATRQDARTSLMAFPVPFLIRYISRIMTLEPGDLIATGTPAGVGLLQDGDVVEVEVEGVGTLRNPVRADADKS
ncbi:MAG TPA: fumarylacetoacetate hydrolase family protein [Pyrinomonadaceae bacterium]|jgi:2-keto-4-pentenoate hydratase/2-oxohepta-3-ene-1,7-dioic acid hydratase in catechol pathway